MFSKSLIQFSLMGQGCVPSLLLDLRPNSVEVMRIMVTSFKRSHAAFSALTLQQATSDPGLFRRLLDTHGDIWVSFLWGHCSFSRVLCAQGLVCVLQESCFPQSCVSSGHSMVGLMATFSKRAYAKPRSVAPRAPALRPATVDLYIHGRHSDTFLAQAPLSMHFVPFPGRSNSLRARLVIFIFIAIVNKNFFHCL